MNAGVRQNHTCSISGGEEFLWVRLSLVAGAAEGFCHCEVDFEVLAVDVAGACANDMCACGVQARCCLCVEEAARDSLQWAHGGA
jgi:hypothetical protein